MLDIGERFIFFPGGEEDAPLTLFLPSRLFTATRAFCHSLLFPALLLHTRRHCSSFFLSLSSSSRASTLTRSSCTRVTLVSLVCVSKSANSAAFHHVPSLGGPVRACALSSPPIPDDCSAIPVSFFLRISFFSASGALERVARCLWGMFRESSRTKNDARNRAKRGKHEDGKRWRPRF